jgi:fructose-1,6-bisphosphatase/inositol monophosphatase family enzyme
MLFSRRNVLAIGDILRQVADTEIMPRFRRLAASDVREKSSAFDIVSDADEAAETAIHAALKAQFPNAQVVGEEACERDASLLARIGSADLAFIVDPIDGTKNFVAGVPLFGSMIAATIKGEIACGAIYDPICRTVAFALRGEGAWIEGDNQSESDLKVASPVPVSKMEAIAGTNFLPEPVRSVVNGNLSKLAISSWLRCAAHEYRMAAAGHCHLLFYNKLMPWDHAAGWLLHREAGGYSAHFDGSAYLPTHLTGGLICAPDKASWISARDALLGTDP